VSKRILIMGGHGNGTVIASTIVDIMQVSEEWELWGYLNDGEEVGSLIEGYPVVGRVTDAARFNSPDVYFIYALATVKKAKERGDILRLLDLPRAKFATIIHPTAVVAHSAQLGFGVVLMPHAVVGPGAAMGDHSQLYAHGFLGHHAKVGDLCFIANNASVGGFVTIQQGAHVGSNSSILERVVIGKWALVGLGAVVLNDVPPYATVVGNPARVIGMLNE
jgi:acetyltransferase EpsM